MLANYHESNRWVIEHRETWNRAQAAIMAKIQENEVARKAMQGPQDGGRTALAAHAAPELSRTDDD